MDLNFSGLTWESQREIFERCRAFDVAVKWVAEFSNMEETKVRQVMLGAASLEAANRSDEDISLYWADIDASKKSIP